MDSLHPNKPHPAFLGISIALGVLTLLATICVALRFIHRRKTIELWWDDWTILAALIFCIGVFINTVLATLPSLGAAGYHITQYSVPQLNTWFKIVLAGEVLYNFSSALSRISVLLFYRRIFSVDRYFLIFMRVMIFLIAASSLAAVFGLIFTTNPVEAQWNVLLPHTSINTRAFYDSTAALNIAFDLAVFGLVQRKVWKLQLDKNRKALLSFLLLLGAFSVVASILRLAYLLVLDFNDVTYSLSTAWLWTVVEIVLYVICACLPGVYAFIKSASGSQRTGSSKSTDFSRSTIKTIGSAPTKSRRIRPEFEDYESRNFLDGSNYQVICEPEIESGYNMRPLDPVRVRRDFEVTSV
ncbi:hypothetical protein F4680DRAFT_419403 [Xylaria scruposa]|nr:hypothetical protein F4680DRAFT_419403 [Xylaria scruposa]